MTHSHLLLCSLSQCWWSSICLLGKRSTTELPQTHVLMHSSISAPWYLLRSCILSCFFGCDTWRVVLTEWSSPWSSCTDRSGLGDGQLSLSPCVGGRGGRGESFGARGRGRAGRSPGRGFGRGPQGMHSGVKRGMDFPEGQPTDKRQKPANEDAAAADGQAEGLASLMQYGSDDEGQAGQLSSKCSSNRLHNLFLPLCTNTAMRRYIMHDLVCTSARLFRMAAFWMRSKCSQCSSKCSRPDCCDCTC